MIPSSFSPCDAGRNEISSKLSDRTVSTVSMASEFNSIRSQHGVVEEMDLKNVNGMESHHKVIDGSVMFSGQERSPSPQKILPNQIRGYDSTRSSGSFVSEYVRKPLTQKNCKFNSNACTANATPVGSSKKITTSSSFARPPSLLLKQQRASASCFSSCSNRSRNLAVRKTKSEVFPSFLDEPRGESPVPPLVPCTPLPCESRSAVVETSASSHGIRIIHNLVQVSLEVLEVVSATLTESMGMVRNVATAAACDWKLSHAILTLRAATTLSERVKEMEGSRSNHWDQENLTLLDLVGDFGLALFSPLNEVAFLPQPEQKLPEGKSVLEESSESEDEPEDDFQYIFQHEIFPVEIEPETAEIEELAPRILPDSMFQQIVDEAIPRSLRMYKWKRVFAIARDGDAFITMLEKCADFKHTLIVIKTTSGHTLGGFASERWRNQDGFDRRHSYFGTGACFLFSDHPANSNPDKDLTTFTWTGVNDYCQICDVDQGKIAMGGGEGDFGLIVEDSFLRGSTGHCATFSNPPLIPGIDGSFDILDFEIYGMLPLIPVVTKSISRSRYSSCRLLKE